MTQGPGLTSLILFLPPVAALPFTARRMEDGQVKCGRNYASQLDGESNGSAVLVFVMC